MTAGFQVSVLVFGLLIIVMFLFARFWQHEYENALKDRNKWRREYERADRESRENYRNWCVLRAEHHRLLNENQNLRYKNIALSIDNQYTTEADADILYAVKYAMKHAHPDKGGKQEDFIRFNEMYRRIKEQSARHQHSILFFIKIMI